MRLLATIILASTPIGAASCSTSSTYRPLTIDVRDGASGAPVDGARVEAQAVHFFVPAPPYAIIDPSPPRSAHGRTGPDGSVELPVIVRHPVRLRVGAPGYAPLELYLDVEAEAAGDAVPAAADWTGDAMPSADDRLKRLEVRVRQAARARGRRARGAAPACG